MFLNITPLVSIEIKTEGDIEIESITKAFEYCSNLINIELSQDLILKYNDFKKYINQK